MGRKTPAVIPERPAPITATCDLSVAFKMGGEGFACLELSGLVDRVVMELEIWWYTNGSSIRADFSSWKRT